MTTQRKTTTEGNTGATADDAVGLVLDLGGAPATPHWIAGVHGFFTPGEPTVVGGPGEITLEQAHELDADESIPLRLVTVPAAHVAERRAAAAEHWSAARGGIVAGRKTAQGLEVSHVRDAAQHAHNTRKG